MKSRFSLVSSRKKRQRISLCHMASKDVNGYVFVFAHHFKGNNFPRHSAFKTSAVEGCYVRSIQYVYVCL